MPAAPRYATARNLRRRTFGPAAGRVAAAMGKPFQPWQQLVADVALEVLEDGTWAYRTIVVSVQRQAGKTTLLGPVHLHRCATRVGAKTWHTAQSRQDGRDSWLDVAAAVTSRPGLSELFAVRRSNGSEGLACLPTGSTFRVFAPTEDALHGKSNELVDVDECWAFDAAQGAALEQAIRPTFTTTGGQLWLVSTAGTSRSTWLRGYVDRGRAAVDAGQDTGLAYFEWSLSPAHAELVAAGVGPDASAAARDQALALTLAAHPGEYVRPDVLAAELTSGMTPGEFLRAYGNVWTATSDREVPAHLWDACRASSWPQPLAPVALAFDVAADRSTAAVVAAWRDTAGGPLRVDVIDSHPGDSWLVPRLRELERRWRPAAVGFDSVGPAVDVADELTRGGMELRPTTAREYAAACAALLSAITNRTLSHHGQPALDEAVEAAATRPLGDGGWAWSRRASAASIAPLVAATVAGWSFDHRPPPPIRPVVASSRAHRPRTRNPA